MPETRAREIRWQEHTSLQTQSILVAAQRKLWLYAGHWKPRDVFYTFFGYMLLAIPLAIMLAVTSMLNCDFLFW